MKEDVEEKLMKVKLHATLINQAKGELQNSVDTDTQWSTTSQSRKKEEQRNGIDALIRKVLYVNRFEYLQFKVALEIGHCVSV